MARVHCGCGQMMVGDQSSFPGSAPGGPSPLAREGLLRQAGALSPLQLFSWSRTYTMPGHASNIYARLAQSGCCPGARMAGEAMTSGAQIQCSNGHVYVLENYQGGIRARAINGAEKPECDLIEEGGLLTLAGLSGAAASARLAQWGR